MFAALIPLVLQNLPAIIKLGEAGFNFVHSIRSAAVQSGEWTPDHQAQFDAGLQADALAPEWQPDKQ